MSNELVFNKISNSIHFTDPKAEAFLFGSRARGDNRNNSDWDLLILVDNENVTNEIEDIFRDSLYDIELESGQTISTIIYPKNFWYKTLVYSPLYKNINNEGLKL